MSSIDIHHSPTTTTIAMMSNGTTRTTSGDDTLLHALGLDDPATDTSAVAVGVAAELTKCVVCVSSSVSDRTIGTVASAESYTEEVSSVNTSSASAASVSASESLLSTSITSSRVISPLSSPIKHRHESESESSLSLSSSSSPMMTVAIDSPAKITMTTTSTDTSCTSIISRDIQQNGKSDKHNQVYLTNETDTAPSTPTTKPKSAASATARAKEDDNDTEGTELDHSFNSNDSNSSDSNSNCNCNLSSTTHSSIISDGSLRHLISSTDKALSIEEHDLQKEITRPFVHSASPLRHRYIEDADDHLWNEIRHLRHTGESLQHEIDFAVDQIAYGHETTRELQDIVCEASFIHGAKRGEDEEEGEEDELLKVIAEGANQMESLGKLMLGKVKEIICCDNGQETLVSNERDNVNGDYIADSKQFDSFIS